MTYRAIYLGDDTTVYSYDAAKAWVSQQAGRTLRWVEAADGKCWYGFKTKAEADEFDPAEPCGYMARILTDAHAEF